jgi:hypothetical protein
MDGTRQSKSDEWAGTLSRWDGSGLSGAAFCRGNGIPQWKFHYWKRRLRGADGAAAGFVEMSFDGDGRHSGLSFDFGSGVRLVVGRGFDAGELARLLREVGGVRC